MRVGHVAEQEFRSRIDDLHAHQEILLKKEGSSSFLGLELAGKDVIPSLSRDQTRVAQARDWEISNDHFWDSVR